MAAVFSVNVFGVVGILNTVIPILHNPSSVVMLGSLLYGLVSPKPALYSHFNDGKGSLKHPAYGASKAALSWQLQSSMGPISHRKCSSQHLDPRGVAAGQDPDFVRKFRSPCPPGTMLSRDDLTGAMTFLLSDESRAMTGQNVVVDGGFTAW